MQNGDLVTVVKTLTVKEPDLTVAYKIEKNFGVLALCLGSVRTNDPVNALSVAQIHARIDRAVATYKEAHPLPPKQG